MIFQFSGVFSIADKIAAITGISLFQIYAKSVFFYAKKSRKCLIIKKLFVFLYKEKR